MKIDFDTDWELGCAECECIIQPGEPKVVSGLMINTQNWLLVYCVSCWERVQQR